MTPYDEMKRAQDEWDNDQRRIHAQGHGDIFTDEDIEAFAERLEKAKGGT